MLEEKSNNEPLESTSQLNILDLNVLAKAVETAAKKQAFSDLEVMQIKPHFDNVVKFLDAYHKQIQASSATQPDTVDSKLDGDQEEQKENITEEKGE